MKKLIFGIYFLFFASIVHAQLVKVIIPFAPGGGTDIAFKHFQKFVEEKHKITLVPIYKPGADSLIGMADLADTANDNNVIGISTLASIALYKIKNQNYQFDPVASLGKSTMAVVTHPHSEIKNINDLEKEIKSPGTRKNFAYGAPAQKISIIQLFEHNNSAPKNLIPYKGAGPMITDLLGGHIDVSVVPLNTVKSHIDNGKLVLIASTSEKHGTNLLSRYKNWESVEGFVLLLPQNSDKKIYNKWIEIAKAYCSNYETLQHWTDKFIDPGHANPNLIITDINNAVKYFNSFN